MSDEPELVRVTSPNGTVVNIDAELADQLGYKAVQSDETGDETGDETSDEGKAKPRRSTK